jgi:hypothetical protein
VILAGPEQVWPVESKPDDTLLRQHGVIFLAQNDPNG